MIGKNALIMPPTQRSKGRFLNLQPLSTWAYKMLLLLDKEDSKLSKEHREKLKWLKTHRTLILEIYEQCKTMNKIFKILKNEGLSQSSSHVCEVIF